MSAGVRMTACRPVVRTAFMASRQSGLPSEIRFRLARSVRFVVNRGGCPGTASRDVCPCAGSAVAAVATSVARAKFFAAHHMAHPRCSQDPALEQLQWLLQQPTILHYGNSNVASLLLRSVSTTRATSLRAEFGHWMHLTSLQKSNDHAAEAHMATLAAKGATLGREDEPLLPSSRSTSPTTRESTPTSRRLSSRAGNRAPASHARTWGVGILVRTS